MSHDMQPLFLFKTFYLGPIRTGFTKVYDFAKIFDCQVRNLPVCVVNDLFAGKKVFTLFALFRFKFFVSFCFKHERQICSFNSLHLSHKCGGSETFWFSSGSHFSFWFGSVFKVTWYSFGFHYKFIPKFVHLSTCFTRYIWYLQGICLQFTEYIYRLNHLHFFMLNELQIQFRIRKRFISGSATLHFWLTLFTLFPISIRHKSGFLRF